MLKKDQVKETCVFLANTAATLGGVVFFLSFFPYTLVQGKYDTLSLASKLFLSLFSNTAMAYGFQLMLMFEGTGEGKQWILCNLQPFHKIHQHKCFCYTTKTRAKFKLLWKLRCFAKKQLTPHYAGWFKRCGRNFKGLLFKWFWVQ